MSQYVVPRYAYWLVIFGVAAPIIGALGLQDYSQSLSLWGNISTKDVVIPLLWGQNPFVCIMEDVQKMASTVVQTNVPTSIGCNKPTTVPYLYLLVVSIFAMAYGGYKFTHPDQVTDKWPTEWRVYDKKSVKPDHKPAADIGDGG